MNPRFSEIVIARRTEAMGERLHLGQSRNRLKRGTRARIDNNIFATEDTGTALGQLNFDSLGSDEVSCAHHQFRAALLVVVEMNVDQVLYHIAFALTHSGHVDAEHSLC
jgi:hypothetical protein